MEALNSKTYHAAVYLRLSREDGDVAEGSRALSNSISNQKELVMHYLRSHAEIQVYAGNVTEVTYTIVSGDTLWKIADRFYGSGTLWTKIFADNADIIKDANKIYVGQVIRLYIMDQPEQASISAVPTTTSIPLENTGQLPIDAEVGEVYVVHIGDSLWKIAAKLYGDGHTWRNIYAANQDVLRAPGKIYAGQRLIIPDK